jgi:hypothetical protein
MIISANQKKLHPKKRKMQSNSHHYIVISFGILSLLCFLIVSCGTSKDENGRPLYPKYEVGSYRLVPDSLRHKQREWITKTVAAASNHMTGGDYEDPEDLVDEVTEESYTVFSVDVATLSVKTCSDCYWDNLDPRLLTTSQKATLDSLQKH